MRASTANTEPIQRRDAQRAGEIAVGSAAAALMRDVEADGPRQAARMVVQRHHAAIRFPHRPRHAARDMQHHIGGGGGQRQHPLDPRIQVLLALGHRKDLKVAMRGDAIHPLPAADHAGGEGAILRRHRLDRQNLAAHLPDRAAAFAERRTGMARPAGGPQVEARNGIASGHHAAIGAGRFRHQHELRAPRLGLDDVAGGRAADFLIRGQQEGDGQRGGDAGHAKVAHRLRRQKGAALHVEDAGAVDPRALAPPGEAFQRADGMDGVEMRQHQDARRVVARRVREARADAITEAHPPRDPLHPRAEQRQVPAGQRHHAVHRRAVEGRRFAFHPGPEPGQDRVRVEGQVEGGRARGGGIHAARLRA